MLPFGAEPLVRGQETDLRGEGSWWLQIMVRLKREQSIEQANAALRSVQPQVLESATRSNPSLLREPLTLAPAATGNSSLRDRFETPLLAMVVAAGLVLLVACANIASLLLARALGRRRELERAPGAGELALADRAAALHREPDRGCDRCRVRVVVREVERCRPPAAIEHVGEHCVARPRTRLARTRVHGDCRVPVGDHRWRRPRDWAEERYSRRGAQRRRPRRLRATGASRCAARSSSSRSAYHSSWSSRPDCSCVRSCRSIGCRLASRRRRWSSRS